MHCNPFQIYDFPTIWRLLGLGGDWHARRPCPDSSADHPSLARGCPCHYPRLHRPSPLRHPFDTSQSTPPSLLQVQRTPLHYAAEDGDEAACRVLIDAGAKVNAESNVS